MKNKIKNDVLGYNCILRKIKHKPIIVECLFSFIKDKPYKFLNLIEKDSILKESLNSIFNFSLKVNNFSKELNNNIRLIKIFKKMKEYCINLKNKDNIYSPYELYDPYKFEKYIIENNNIDPSFIIYKSNIIFNKICGELKIKPSISSFIDITFYEKMKYEQFNLVYLPSNKNEYKDCLFIQRFLNNEINLNNESKKEIETLYCIIDKYKFYNDNLYIINKDIIINNLFFIYIKKMKI